MSDELKPSDPVDPQEHVPKAKDDLWDSEFWMDESNYSTESQSISTAPSPACSFFDVVVTTGDIKQDYRIIGPVYFQLSNKAFFQSEFRKYEEKHRRWLQEHYSNGQIQKARGWSGLFGEIAIGQSQFDTAFFIAVQELKLRAFRLGGNAIVAMRQDIDLDTVGIQGFYLQMYGTAVKLSDESAVAPT
jgi:uncharacterized protein YbjQ (UPF0145 family)